MKVFITGITGLIGSHLARYLSKEKKYQIFGFKRWRSDQKNIKDLFGPVKFIEGGIEDTISVYQTIIKIKPDLIIHLAAQSYPSESWKAPIMTFNTNVIGTINVLEAAKDLPKKPKIFIACSSAEYGLIKKEDCPIKEDHPKAPLSPYGVSKVAQELLGIQYFYSYGLPIYLGRFFNQIGPGQDERCSIQTFCKQVAEIEKGIQSPILSVGNLSTKRDFLDVRDGIKAIISILDKGKAGEVYNICSGQAYLLKNLLEKIVNKTRGKIKIKIDKKRLRLVDEPIIQGDNHKIKKLGWSPKIPIEDSITDILNYWRQII